MLYFFTNFSVKIISLVWKILFFGDKPSIKLYGKIDYVTKQTQEKRTVAGGSKDIPSQYYQRVSLTMKLKDQ